MCVRVHDDWDAFYAYWSVDLGAPGRLVAFRRVLCPSRWSPYDRVGAVHAIP